MRIVLRDLLEIRYEIGVFGKPGCPDGVAAPAGVFVFQQPADALANNGLGGRREMFYAVFAQAYERIALHRLARRDFKEIQQ